MSKFLRGDDDSDILQRSLGSWRCLGESLGQALVFFGQGRSIPSMKTFFFFLPGEVEIALLVENCETSHEILEFYGSTAFFLLLYTLSTTPPFPVWRFEALHLRRQASQAFTPQ
jgi:hypothetical protein